VVYSLTETERPYAVLSKQKTYALTINPIKPSVAVRDIHTATDTLSFRFVAGNGIDDSGQNSFNVIQADLLDYQEYSQDKHVDFCFNQFRLNTRINGVDLYFYLNAQPFLFIDDSILQENVETKFKLLVSDDGGKGESASLDATITRFKDGY
jgi:hypothetical protein